MNWTKDEVYLSDRSILCYSSRSSQGADGVWRNTDTVGVFYTPLIRRSTLAVPSAQRTWHQYIQMYIYIYIHPILYIQIYGLSHYIWTKIVMYIYYRSAILKHYITHKLYYIYIKYITYIYARYIYLYIYVTLYCIYVYGGIVD